MAVLSCEALGIEPLNNIEQFFADCRGKDEEKVAYINAAYTEYLVSGIGKDTDGALIFEYGQPVTRAQLATMALRIKAYKEDAASFKNEQENRRKLEPDEAKEEPIQTAGITGGNVSNISDVAMQGDWIYYRVSWEGERAFYKIRLDGTSRTKINNDFPSTINVVGDWLYYYNGNDSSLMKVRTDGSDRTKLIGGGPDYITVVGDWIYFQLYYVDDFKIMKMRTDGSDLTVLRSGQVDSMNVEGDWIYYSNFTYYKDEKRGIFKIRTDGSGETKITDDNALRINVVDGWIYYVVKDYKDDGSSTHALYKIRTDGSNRTKIDGDSLIEYLNVSGDWIYYDYATDLYKIRTDGSNKTKLSGDHPWFINVVGDWIYYTNTDDGYKTYRIRTDGSDRQVVR